MLLRGISSDPYEGALEEDLRRDILRELYAEQTFMMSLGACPKQGPTPSTELNISIHHKQPHHPSSFWPQGAVLSPELTSLFGYIVAGK